MNAQEFRKHVKSYSDHYIDQIDHLGDNEALVMADLALYILDQVRYKMDDQAFSDLVDQVRELGHA